ncbi:Uroporphyrinogen decarboxylase (URO-D) [Methanohalobium evestigatum Z-7303]|uniref:Uroporphyrinogen decarboxylase (URO-D) n=1 Tax=Methanohalobium evestigatum (strain ATCC BAA-1072 / DSM 3721 / NBRC 107634 / OCM 161 / Z-7303) TaxID=644295 RepID=D7E919_METEZ|nr:methylcobamide--CoM methyltransferase [Methanohalobium evestigatum]ADI73967.1 Uroporphyrinogen decarboxylase (URO-D) [Methanohalobium evestigatum Z-7303]
MREEMTSKERFINALEMKDVDRVPYGYLWFGAGDAVLKRMNTSMKDVYYSSEGIAKAQMLAREMYHHDNVMSPWGCLLVEAEALGTIVNIKEDRYPTVAEYALKSSKEYDTIEPQNIKKSERIETVSKSVSILKKELNDEVFITGSIMSPLMLATQVLEMVKLCEEMIMEKENVHYLLERLTDGSILYADRMLEEGVDGFLVENGENTADLFSPQMADEFALKYTKKLYNHIHKNGGYVISHNCAEHAFHEKDVSMKPDAMNFAFGDVSSLGNRYGVECIKNHNHKNIGCGPRYCFKDFEKYRTCLMGNINPNVFGNGSLDDIENEVESCIKAAPNKGFILSTGCEIPLGTKQEKMDTLWNTMKSHF